MQTPSFVQVQVKRLSKNGCNCEDKLTGTISTFHLDLIVWISQHESQFDQFPYQTLSHLTLFTQCDVILGSQPASCSGLVLIKGVKSKRIPLTVKESVASTLA